MKNKGFFNVIFDIINYVVMIILCVITLYPFLNQLAISFNEGLDTAFGGLTIFPRKFTLDNYRVVFENKSLWNGMLITCSNVVLGSICGLLVSVLSAYALNKPNMPFRKMILWFLIIPIYIGAGSIPTYVLYSKIGLINNYLVYILPNMFVFYNMLVIRTYIRGIPVSLLEAASIDGASEFQIVFKILMPLCKPVLATVVLWIAVGKWNQWTTCLVYITNRKLYTLQYIMMQIIKESEIIQSVIAESQMSGTEALEQAKITTDAVKAATLMFTTVPIIAAYPYLQKYFVKGVTIGSVKE